MAGLYHFFVEGECEAVLLKAFMHSDDKEYHICPGKIEIVNPLYQKITPVKAMTLKKRTKVIFVYDTDVKQTDILEQNIEAIVKYSSLEYGDILFIQSVNNLEDELVYACDNLSNINDLLGTKGKEEFKKKLVKHKDIVTKLKGAGFHLNKMWCRNPKPPFSSFKQGFETLINK